MLPVQQGEAWVQPVTEAYVVSISVLKSHPRTTKRPTTGPNFYWLQLDCSCGPGGLGISPVAVA